jgi:FMN phosphatase YigB (HAD superfamily)
MSLFVFQTAQGAIHTAERVANVAALFHAGDMVIFDLDNTVFVSHHTFGSDRWFDREMRRHMAQGSTREEAIVMAQQTADAASIYTLHSPVEDEVKEMIDELQARGVTVFALTARRPVQAEETFRALNTVGVSFEATHPVLSATFDDHYEKGVLFAAARPKGPILLKFLKAIGAQPSMVVFIDDRMENVQSVLNELEAANIQSAGIHYSAHESILIPYREDVVELQRQAFLAGERIPTDSEAIEQLESHDKPCDQMIKPVPPT